MHAGVSRQLYKVVEMLFLKLPRNSSSSYKTLKKSESIDIRSMVSISDTDIDSLTYDKSKTAKDVLLSRRNKSLLHIFHHYIIHHNSVGDQLEIPGCPLLPMILTATKLILTTLPPNM